MRLREITEDASATAGLDALYEMANLFSRTTGLPMTVWVSPRGAACHDACIKINMTHGSHMDPTNTAVVALRPAPHLQHGQLRADDQDMVFSWATLNSVALLQYWEGEIDTIQLGELLRPVQARG